MNKRISKGLLIRTPAHRVDVPKPEPVKAEPKLKLSIVVGVYNMARELPRTLKSLSPPIQHGISVDDFEIIVVDNGSTIPFDRNACTAIAPNIRFVNQTEPTISPAKACNLGLRLAKAPLVGLFCDGARMASPGILVTALEAHRLNDRAVVATHGFHLGPDVQMKTIKQGYDAFYEDELLKSSEWEADGYRLFAISSFGVSSGNGWFRCFSESNGLFMTKEMWLELGGMDERFATPGGGYVNLDLFERAVSLQGSRVIVQLGEGTFHQVHGGAATNSEVSKSAEFRAEYATIRGRPYKTPEFERSFFGSPRPEAMWSIETSARKILRLERPRRRRHLGQEYEVDLPDTLLSDMQAATLKMNYKGRRFLKNAFDIVLYTRLLGELMPRTIIEIGTNGGGSALWFSDLMSAHGKAPRVVGFDLTKPEPATGVTFLEADANDLSPILIAEVTSQWPKPWLVIEDSAHIYETTLAVAEAFHPLLKKGDYLIIEDGIVSHIQEAPYLRYRDGPIRATAEFLNRYPGMYENDSSYADFFGQNGTWNPGGWLRRIA